MKKLKRVSSSYSLSSSHPYHNMKKKKYIISSLILKYKPLFFRWLKNNSSYELYQSSYRNIVGNMSNFDETILLHCLKNHFMLITPINIMHNFMTILIDHCKCDSYFDDDLYDSYYLLRFNWMNFVNENYNNEKK